MQHHFVCSKVQFIIKTPVPKPDSEDKKAYFTHNKGDLKPALQRPNLCCQRVLDKTSETSLQSTLLFRVKYVRKWSFHSFTGKMFLISTFHLSDSCLTFVKLTEIPLGIVKLKIQVDLM